MFYGVIDWKAIYAKECAPMNDAVAVFERQEDLEWWLNHGDYTDLKLPIDDYVPARREIDFDEAYGITCGAISDIDTYKEDDLFPERFKWCW